MKNLAISALSWPQPDNLLPAIIQDADTLQVLMLGYMNPQALQQTLDTGFVTFYSRSKQRLWVKGETSGNKLALQDVQADCDQDSLLIQARPQGPTCHLNQTSCFNQDTAPGVGFIAHLEKVIAQRAQHKPENSYTAKLLQQGITRIAQKVGEEGVEVALAAVVEKDKLCDEMTDLWYHCLVLLNVHALSIQDIIQIMQERVHHSARHT